MCSPQRLCPFGLYLSFLKYDSAEDKSVQKMKGRKASRTILGLKGFQCSYVRNARAGAFHRGKMPSFARVVLAPGPAETGEPGAQSGAYPCESSSSVDAKVPQSPTQGRRKKPKPTATRTPLNPYPPNLTAPTTFLLFPTLSNVPFRLKHSILKSI